MIQVHTRQPSLPRGFTLVESVFSLVIVSVMLLAAISTLGASARTRQMTQTQAARTQLARDLMHEITALPFDPPEDDPNPSNGDRNEHTDIGDYDGWKSSPPEFRDGDKVPGREDWSRSVAVYWVDPDQLDRKVNNDTGWRRIEVTVEDPEGRTETITSLRSRSGVSGLRSAGDESYFNVLTIQMQTASNDIESFSTSVTLLNTPSGEALGASNLLTNGGFEDGLTGWSPFASTLKLRDGDAHSGDGYVRVEDLSMSPDGPGGIYQSIPGVLEKGHSYYFEVWIRPRDDDDTVRVKLLAVEGADVWSAEVSGTAEKGEWNHVSGMLNANWTNTPDQVVLAIHTDTLQKFEVDDAAALLMSGVAMGDTE